MKEGLSDDVRKSLLKKYPRKGDFYAEPPKINLEITPALSEITKKRDEHFVETQECVGSAIMSVGAALSLLLDTSDKEVDELKLMEYLSDAGKLLAETFHQHSVARKSYITPVMKKGVKTLVDSIPPDQWLYGDKLAEQLKEAKAIENACQNLKVPEKATKKPLQRSQAYQGNLRGPPAYHGQTGTNYQRKFSRFKARSSRTSQIPSREKTQTQTKDPRKK